MYDSFLKVKELCKRNLAKRYRGPRCDLIVEQLIQEANPFVIRKNILHWPALKKWQNIKYFQEKFNDLNIPIENYTNSFYSQESLKLIEMTFEEYCKENTDPKYRLYLAELDIFNKYKKNAVLKALREDIAHNFITQEVNHVKSVLFYGTDSVTQMHYHRKYEAALNQICGRKTILLFPPTAFYQMKPHPWFHKLNNWSRILFKVKNADEFINISESLGFESGHLVTLEPGDSLYIPIYWWHIVFGEKLSISVTDFAKSKFRKVYLSFLGLRSRNYMNFNL